MPKAFSSGISYLLSGMIPIYAFPDNHNLQPCCLVIVWCLASFLHPQDQILKLPIHITMFSRARWRCFEWTLKLYSLNPRMPSQLPITSQYPSFVPNCNFSASPQKLSKIGKAPLSIPPGVTFEILPPVIGKRKRDAADQQKGMATVHIKGPLGEMSMPILPFITISRETPDSAPTLSIQNPEEKFQKAMWGASILSHPK